MEPTLNQGMIDTTDSLEAVSVMKGMKNFLFWVLLAALLVSQVVFWMDRGGLIDKSDCAVCAVAAVPTAPAACPKACPAAALPVVLADPNKAATGMGLVPLAAQAVIVEQVERVTQKVGLQAVAEAESAAPAEQLVVIEQTPAPQESPKKTLVEVIDKEMEFLKISCFTARSIIRVSNFFIFMAAMLYCLTLLMNLKISLTGTLGGINHISRAFFCSLFLLVFLTPWQVLLPGVAIGAMYLPSELLCGAWAKAESSNFWKVLMYLRFTGLWLVALWLLVSAQMRSIKWARATLRRLGMAR